MTGPKSTAHTPDRLSDDTVTTLETYTARILAEVATLRAARTLGAADQAFADLEATCNRTMSDISALLDDEREDD